MFAYVASVAQNFHARPGRDVQTICIGWVEVGARGETVAVSALDDEQLHRAVALRDAGGQFDEMAR